MKSNDWQMEERYDCSKAKIGRGSLRLPAGHRCILFLRRSFRLRNPPVWVYLRFGGRRTAQRNLWELQAWIRRLSRRLMLPSFFVLWVFSRSIYSSYLTINKDLNIDTDILQSYDRALLFTLKTFHSPLLSLSSALIPVDHAVRLKSFHQSSKKRQRKSSRGK